ncbi:MAG: hypothetical protein ABSH51_24240 [Solirubrobacteraceae bacterium]|jgi:hypothetical protein
MAWRGRALVVLAMTVAALACPAAALAQQPRRLHRGGAVHLELTFVPGLPHQTDVICAYLVQGLDDLAVGYDRFVPDKPKPKSKHRARHKR